VHISGFLQDRKKRAIPENPFDPDAPSIVT